MTSELLRKRTASEESVEAEDRKKAKIVDKDVTQTLQSEKPNRDHRNSAKDDDTGSEVGKVVEQPIATGMKTTQEAVEIEKLDSRTNEQQETASEPQDLDASIAIEDAQSPQPRIDADETELAMERAYELGDDYSESESELSSTSEIRAVATYGRQELEYDQAHEAFREVQDEALEQSFDQFEQMVANYPGGRDQYLRDLVEDYSSDTSATLREKARNREFMEEDYGYYDED
ncbi:hypothetical protein BDV96DRAFT_651889 [Lophiotrema nucula]|uniref:Uncharacterized protein n=1 Tax=Lophiotrema nucula TaxID=690887 RepID=A0A6A5YQP0_9PLEO|nr:hypothetical protein BDV96DRAFT_651889 [Lophiotrema nucula]